MASTVSACMSTIERYTTTPGSVWIPSISFAAMWSLKLNIKCSSATSPRRKASLNVLARFNHLGAGEQANLNGLLNGLVLCLCLSCTCWHCTVVETTGWSQLVGLFWEQGSSGWLGRAHVHPRTKKNGGGLGMRLVTMWCMSRMLNLTAGFKV